MKRYFVMLCSLVMAAAILLGAAQPAMAANNSSVLDIIQGILASQNPKEDASEKQPEEIVQFVSSLYSSVFAVLYEDGTVGVGALVPYDEEDFLDAYAPALQWKNVKKLYLNVNTLVGLCEDGTVYSVSLSWGDDFVPLNTKHLKNVVDVAYMEPDSRFFFLLEDGTVESASEGDKEYVDFVPFDGVFENWTGVEKLVSYYYYDIFALCEDGSVKSMAGDSVPNNWKNIRDLYVDGKYYGIKEDGCVVIYNPNPDFYLNIPKEEKSLAGAQELYAMGEVMFGLNKDGDLLVSGGKDWFFNDYAQYENVAEANWSKFKNIKQLIASKDYGMDYVMAVTEEGEAVALNPKIQKYFSYLPEVEKLVMAFAQDGTTYICGMEKDGNVVGIEILMDDSAVIHNDDFYGWNVTDIYATKSGCVIGFCSDGSFVTTYESEYNYLDYLPPL